MIFFISYFLRKRTMRCFILKWLSRFWNRSVLTSKLRFLNNAGISHNSVLLQPQCSFKRNIQTTFKSFCIKVKKPDTWHLQKTVHLFRKLQFCESVLFFRMCVLSGILLSLFLPFSLSPASFALSLCVCVVSSGSKLFHTELMKIGLWQ